MIQYIKNSLIILLVFLTACQSKQKTEVEGLPFFNTPDFTPEWIDKSESRYASIHTIPSFTFIDQNGQTITEKTVTGKIYVADFFFTSCGSICPTMTGNMHLLHDAYKDNKDVLLLSHTVLPEMDSVPVLKKYAETRNIIGDKWHLLTGDKEKIYSLARQQYFAGDTIGYYQGADDFLHTENFILVDKKRRIRGVYNGTLLVEMDRLKEDINTLLLEE